MLKFICAVIAAAAFAGVLSSLSATTSARPIALAKPQEASLKPAPHGLGPVRWYPIARKAGESGC